MLRILHGTLDLSDGRDWQRNHSSFTPSLLTFQFPPPPPSHFPLFLTHPHPHPSPKSFICDPYTVHLYEAFLSYLFSIFFSSVVFSPSYLLFPFFSPFFLNLSITLLLLATISCSCYIPYTSSSFVRFSPPMSAFFLFISPTDLSSFYLYESFLFITTMSSFSLVLLPLRIFLYLSLAHLLNFASFSAFLSLLFYVPHYLLLCLTYSHLSHPLLYFYLPPVQCSQQ